MDKMNTDRKSLKKFGVTMGTAFLVIGTIIFLKHKQINQVAGALSAAFFLSAFTLPGALKPLYIFWMRLALVLSWINTRLILTALFYLILTPIGLLMRIFGADLLNRKTEKDKESYWSESAQKEFNPRDYERQF